MKAKKCKVCKNEFTPIYTTAQSTCSLSCAIEQTAQKKTQAWKERKKILKDELTTVQDLMKVAQQVFNKYIRLRDEGNLCISCGKKLRKGNIDAGHMWSAGGHSNVRFNELNVNSQCSRPCNKDKAGDINNYRIGFVQRYGIDKLNDLDSIAKLEKKFSKEELKDIIDIYKKKYKDLNNNVNFTE
jgi:hypothetical protein